MYKLSVTYGAGETATTNENEHLTSTQTVQGMAAFLRDMMEVPDSVIMKLVIEREA
jgi:arabinogalactan endo-1,4-beta-galactosidase